MTFRTGRFDFNDGGTYVGQWYRGCAHGLGLATGPNGVGEYSGQWDAGFETCGVYVWPSGNVYAGTWSKGKRHGYGQQIRGKWIYQGQFTAGTCGPCGVKAMCNSQSMYEGSWCLNRFEGYGVETCADGSVYAGSWSRGLRQGLGVRRSYIRVPVNSSETETTKKATLDSLLSSILNRNNDKLSNISTLDSMGDKESDSAQLSQVIQTETHQVYGGFTDCGRVGRALTKRLRRQHSAFELGCPMSPKVPEPTTDVEENSETSPSSLMSSSQKLRAMSFRMKGLTRTPVNVMSSPEKRSEVTKGQSPNRPKAAVGTSEPSASDWITSVEIYAGEWVEDKRTGYGISERSDGYRYIGEWLQNQRHGYGVVHQPDGTQDEGQFQADHITKRLGRKSKLQILRQSKLKDCIEYAVLRATDAAKEAKNKAAKMAQEKAKLARNAAESAENHLLKARNLSQLARDFVRENEPQFHQPGLEWEKKRHSERLSSTRPIGNPAELSPSIDNSEQNAEDKESSICLHQNLEDCKTVPTTSEAGENPKVPMASTVKSRPTFSRLRRFGRISRLSSSQNLENQSSMQFWGMKLHKLASFSRDSACNFSESRGVSFTDLFEASARSRSHRRSTPDEMTPSLSTQELEVESRDHQAEIMGDHCEHDKINFQATELTNQNMDSLRNSDDARSLYNSDSTTATITSIADSVVATEVGLNEESCAKKSTVGISPTDFAVERHSVSRSTPATTPEPSRSYSESFEGRSPVRLPAPRISRMDFAQYHYEEAESSQLVTPESRRTGSLDLSSCHQSDYNVSKEAYSAPDSVNVKRITSGRLALKFRRVPSTEETPFDLAPTPVVHEMTKPATSNSLSIENQHPPKLGSQPTQDSGYHSIDPSDSRSFSSRWPTHSMLHQTSQKFDELVESELDQVPSANTGNNNSREMHKKRHDSLFRSTQTQWTEFDRPSERLVDRARSRPMSCFAYRDSDQTRFSPPIPKRARVRMNGRQSSLVDKRKHLYPKRRFPSENSRSGLQSFGVTESLYSQTPYHDVRCLQYQRPHNVRVPKEPLFVRVVHHPSWVHHIPQRPFQSRQSTEHDYPASQYSEGEGSSDHSEYSMATVQSAPLYPSLGSYRGVPMANASMWSSPGFRFHHSRKAPPNYDRSREVDRYFMNYPPHLRRAGSGTPRVRPAMNTTILPDTCHEDPCVYTQPVRFQTNVDALSSEPKQFSPFGKCPQKHASSLATSLTTCSLISCMHSPRLQYATHTYPRPTSTYSGSNHFQTHEFLPSSTSALYDDQRSECGHPEWYQYGGSTQTEFPYETHRILQSTSLMSPVLSSGTVFKQTMSRAVQVDPVGLETDLSAPFDYTPHVETTGVVKESYVERPLESWHSNFTKDPSDTCLQVNPYQFNVLNMAILRDDVDSKMIREQTGDVTQSRKDHWQPHTTTESTMANLPMNYFGASPSTVPVRRRVSWPSSRLIHHTYSSSKVTSRRNSQHSNSSATVIASRSSPTAGTITSTITTTTTTTNQQSVIPPSQTLVAEQPNITEENGLTVMSSWGQSMVQKVLRYCRKLLQRSPPLMHNFTHWIAQNVAFISMLFLNMMVFVLCAIIWRLLQAHNLQPTGQG